MLLFGGASIATGLLVVIGLGATNVARNELAYLGFLFMFPGGIALLFAAEPRFARTLSALFAAAAFISNGILLYIFALFAKQFSRASAVGATCVVAEDSSPAPCPFIVACACALLSSVLFSSFFIVAMVRLVLSDKRPFEILRSCVRHSGILAAGLSASLLVRVGAGAALGLLRAGSALSLMWALIISEMAVTAASAVLLLSGLHGWIQVKLAQRGTAFTTAAGISALLQGREPAAVQALALSRLRAVSAAQVTLEGLRSNAADQSLFALSAPARVGEVDLFVSHSWHDEHEPKFQALQAWRARFVRVHNREPLLWIDRYCIDQSAIDIDIVCLPLFLAGCSKLLILAGPTWLNRLWCVVELVCWGQMHSRATDPMRGVEVVELRPSASSPRASSSSSRAGAEPPPEPQPEPPPVRKTRRHFKLAAVSSLLRLGERRARKSSVAPEPGSVLSFTEQLDCFDVRNAQCTSERDYERLIAMIEASTSSFEDFNATVAAGLSDAVQKGLDEDEEDVVSSWRKSRKSFSSQGQASGLFLSRFSASATESISRVTKGIAVTSRSSAPSMSFVGRDQRVTPASAELPERFAEQQPRARAATIGHVRARAAVGDDQVLV